MATTVMTRSAPQTSARVDAGARKRTSSRQEDRALVRRLIAGDERAFDVFSDTYIPALYRFALYRLDGDADLAQEIVQATLCRAIAKLASFRGEAALMTWLCACCRTEIAAHFRRRSRMGREVELEADCTVLNGGWNSRDLEGPEQDLLSKEAAQLVHIALDLLPARYGQALEWKYLEDLSVKEIAGRLNLSPKAAESLLTRARQSFRERYERLAADVKGPLAGAGMIDTRMGAEP